MIDNRSLVKVALKNSLFRFRKTKISIVEYSACFIFASLESPYEYMLTICVFLGKNMIFHINNKDYVSPENRKI